MGVKRGEWGITFQEVRGEQDQRKERWRVGPGLDQGQRGMFS